MEKHPTFLLDKEAVFAVAGHNSPLIHALLTAMLADNACDLKNLDLALSAGCWQQVAHHLHRLAGSVRMTGSHSLAAQCEEMESMARYAPDLAALREEQAFLLAAMHRLEREVEQWLAEQAA